MSPPPSAFKHCSEEQLEQLEVEVFERLSGKQAEEERTGGGGENRWRREQEEDSVGVCVCVLTWGHED